MAKEMTAEEYFIGWSEENAEREKQLTEASNPEKVISEQRVDMLKKNIDSAFARFTEVYASLQNEQAKNFVSRFAVAQLSLVERDKKNFENSEFFLGTDECDSVLRGLKGITIAINEGKTPEEFMKLMNITHYNHRSFEWLSKKMRDIYTAEYNHRFDKKVETDDNKSKQVEKDKKVNNSPNIDTNVLFARFTNIYQSLQNERARKVFSNLALSEINLVQQSMNEIKESAQGIEECEKVLSTLENAVTSLNDDKTPEEFNASIDKEIAKSKNLKKYITLIYNREYDHKYELKADDALGV